ncbi:MAG: helix-turn-helix transcriptional regulator [Chitinophagaceae bacterium]|nr:helix-turn-helix transcriptional regulator [Chitinophagaceae bacterium]
MAKVETIAEFYKRKFDWVPDDIRKELGHFNIFALDPFVGKHAQPVPYSRRDFYKITFVKGAGTVHFADKLYEVNGLALTFSSPLIPYKWDHTDQATGGYFCIFDKNFFHQFGQLEKYSVYQPAGNRVFMIDAEQAAIVEEKFRSMQNELASDYAHKYDILRSLVLELIHFALKIDQPTKWEKQNQNAASRISTLFLELLERQFPIDELHQSIQVRHASEFACQLNVHVNHLNRAVKETTGKTTTQLIGERLLQEAKILVKHSPWNIGEIAVALGFAETTHFNNFFKKNTGLSPLQFRKA